MLCAILYNDNRRRSWPWIHRPALVLSQKYNDEYLSKFKITLNKFLRDVVQNILFFSPFMLFQVQLFYVMDT